MSEFSLIYTHFKHATTHHANTVLGIGDDCAISQLPPNYELVSCVDTLVAGRHFVHETDAFAIAYKSVAVNLSDLSAMGATPYAILLGLSLPKSMANDDFCQAFANGLADICGQFGVQLIGGDTTGADILTISVTALGFVPKGQAICRHTAKIDDVICLSGEVGLASFALAQILGKKGHTKTPDALGLLSAKSRQALQYPTPQIALGQALCGFAHSMIDISDGLGQDLGHILTASGVGAKLNLDKIPCDESLAQLPFEQKYQHILNGGDDYQLCFSMSPENLQKFTAQYDYPIYPIGQITQEQGIRLFHQGEQVEFAISGWQHF